MSADEPLLVDEVLGRFAAASNLTLLGRAAGELVVYKPTAGVRPLWDFAPETLAAREILTFRVAQAMGLAAVPETRWGDGALGPGVVQRFVESDPAFDPLPLVARADDALWPVAVLDLVTNNADRKLGHLLSEAGTGRLWAIDHGLTFHPEPKLRTVLWGFSGLPIPPALVSALEQLAAALPSGLEQAVAADLGSAEVAALQRRVRRLLRRPRHPHPPQDRHPVPWPPY
jgi:hypothetical protein